MNALGERFEAMKRRLTTGSERRVLGSEALLDIRRVERTSPQRSPDLQNLGLITNLGYLSFPPEYGVQRCFDPPSESDGEDAQTSTVALEFGYDEKEDTEMISSSLADTDTSSHTAAHCDQPKCLRVHIPKVKKKLNKRQSAPSCQPRLAPSCSPDTCCQTCFWRFPATYSAADVSRHRELASVGKCRKDISEYRESERALRRSKSKRKQPLQADLRAWYGGVRVCPHCGTLLDAGYSCEGKKDHIEGCWGKRCRKDQFEATIVSPETPIDPFSLKISSLLKKSRMSLDPPY